MAIYVGENKALILKSDRSIAKLFKGDNVIFDYDAIAEGEIVTIDNAHSVEHSLGVKVASKNLLLFPYSDGMSKTVSGVTFTVSEDGTLVANGTATALVDFYFVYNDRTKLSFKTGDKVAISGVDGGSASTYRLMVEYKLADGTTQYTSQHSGKGVTLSFEQDATITILAFRIASGVTLDNVIVKPQIEYGTVATEYALRVDNFSNVNVTRCGKNIFDADTVLLALENPSYPSIQWQKQADGSFYIGNSSALLKSKWFENTNGYTGQMAISISVKMDNGKQGENPLSLVFRYRDGTSEPLRCYYDGNYVTYTLVSNPNKIINYIDQSSNIARRVYVKDIMIAYGTDIEYEPYNPQTAIANPDGTVEGITGLPNMTILSDADGVVINCEYVKG